MNWGDVRDRFWWAFPPYIIWPEWVTVPWYELTHLPKWVSMTPPWRRHKPECDERFRRASEELMADPTAMDAREIFQNATLGIAYCRSCDYVECSPTHNRLYFWYAHIESVIDAFRSQWSRRHWSGY